MRMGIITDGVSPIMLSQGPPAFRDELQNRSFWTTMSLYTVAMLNILPL